MQNSRLWSSMAFALCLTVMCLRAFHYPEYRTDGLSYMGNVVAMRGASIQAIHDTVYREAKAGIPAPVFNHLTGRDVAAPASQNLAFLDRATNPYHFAEYLPCFAIRPIFTELVYVLHYWLGIGLLKALLLVPAISYWLLGWLVFTWIGRYLVAPWAALMSTLLLLTPPLWDLARSPGPDALSTLFVLLAAYWLFERHKLLPGTIVLLASVYVRTDNVIFVLLALTCLWLAGFGLRAGETAILSAVAVVSVLLINHFSGDYGLKVAYYRGFTTAPLAVGEFVPAFGLREYLTALKAGIGEAMHGPHILFLLIGLAAMLRRPARGIFALVMVTFAFAAAHFVIFPLAETRYFGPFFVAAGVALGASISATRAARVISPQHPLLRHEESHQLRTMAPTG